MAQKAYEEQMLKATGAQKKTQTLYESIIGSPEPDVLTFKKSAESSNRAAYEAYQAKTALNNAKISVAESEYEKTLDELNEKRSELSPEEFDKKKDEAYQKYVDTKNQLDQDSQDAYGIYQQTYLDNRKKYDNLINAQEEDMSLSAPSQTQTTPTIITPVVSAKKEVTVASQLSDEIMKMFQENFKDDPWYKDNPPKKGEDGNLSLSFKSENDMSSFFQKLASEKKDFIMVDGKTKEVMGYSKNGELFHANGDQFKTGDTFKPGGTKFDSSYKIPEKEQEQTQTQSNTMSSPG